MNKKLSSLAVAAAFAASLAAALPAEGNGPHGIPLPPLPFVHVRPPLPPIPFVPPPPFYVGPVRHAPVWLPDRYYGEWIYTGGAWRHHPYRYRGWHAGYRGSGGWNHGGGRGGDHGGGHGGWNGTRGR